MRVDEGLCRAPAGLDLGQPAAQLAPSDCTPCLPQPFHPQLLVSASGDEDERRLASLGPGSLIEASQVLGRGYCSLFSSHVGLLSALEEARPLVLIAAGPRGVAPVRAALSWTPVLAHATAHRVSLFYLADSPASAAYLVEWDGWRDAGVGAWVGCLTGIGGG